MFHLARAGASKAKQQQQQQLASNKSTVGTAGVSSSSDKQQQQQPPPPQQPVKQLPNSSRPASEKPEHEHESEKEGGVKEKHHAPSSSTASSSSSSSANPSGVGGSIAGPPSSSLHSNSTAEEGATTNTTTTSSTSALSIQKQQKEQLADTNNNNTGSSSSISALSLAGGGQQISSTFSGVVVNNSSTTTNNNRTTQAALKSSSVDNNETAAASSAKATTCDKFQPQSVWGRGRTTCRNCSKAQSLHNQQQNNNNNNNKSREEQQEVPVNPTPSSSSSSAVTTVSLIKSIIPQQQQSERKASSAANLPDIVSTVQQRVSINPITATLNHHQTAAMAESSSGGTDQSANNNANKKQQQIGINLIPPNQQQQMPEEKFGSDGQAIAADLRLKLDAVSLKAEQVLKLNEELLLQLQKQQREHRELQQQQQQQPAPQIGSVASKFGSTLKRVAGGTSSSSSKNQQENKAPAAAASVKVDDEPSLVVKELSEQLRRIRETAASLNDHGRQISEAVVQCDMARSQHGSPSPSPRLSLSSTGQPQSVTTGLTTQQQGELAQRLHMAEELCRSLRDENEQLREEMEYVRLEIDEVRDRVRDEEGREFGELQKELDMAAKNCRILQFKLRKAERRVELAETEKTRAEEQLRANQRRTDKFGQEGGSNDQQDLYLRELEEELRVAKEVSVRLHDELELAEERRAKFEIDSERLRNLLRQADQERLGLEKEVDALRKQLERVQGHVQGSNLPSLAQVVDAQTQSLPPELMSTTPGSRLLVRSATAESAASPLATSMHSSFQTGAPGRQGSFDSEWSELKRDLCDSLEREQDLREQLKYAEEQIKSLRKKLNDFEEENESLIMQVKRLMNRSKQAQQSSQQKATSSSPTDEVQQLHLDLSEQEVKILKRKLEAAERQNDSLFGQVKELQGKLSLLNSHNSLSTHSDGPEDSSKDGKKLPGQRHSLEKQLSSDVIGQQDGDMREKLAELTREAEDLRTLLKEKESELQALMDLPANASSDQKTVHFKRQLDLLRQETLLLRDKITKQEAEKQQLQSQNQRLTERIEESLTSKESSEKSGGGPDNASRLDSLEQDNQALKAKLKVLEDDRKKEQFLAAERLSLFDKELAETHVKLSFLQAENEQLIAKLEQIQAAKQAEKSESASVSAEDWANRNKVLQEKVANFQREIDELLAVIAAKDSNEQRLQATISSLEVELDRRSGEFARRETDMLSSIATLKRNNTVLSSLLDLMTERAEITQATLDKYLQTLSTPPDIIAATGAGDATPNDSVTQSTIEGLPTAEQLLARHQPVDEIQLKVKIISLEKKLVDAEARIAEVSQIKDELEKELSEADRNVASLQKSEQERAQREESLMNELMSVSAKNRNEQQAAAQQLAQENRRLLDQRSQVETALAECRVQMLQLEVETKRLKQELELARADQAKDAGELERHKEREQELDAKLNGAYKELAAAKDETKRARNEAETTQKALRDELAQKSEMLKKVEREAATKAKELQKKELDLAEKEKAIKSKDSVSSKRDDTLKQQEEAIKQLKADKSKLQEEVKAKTDEARRLGEQVQKLTEQLAEKDAKLAEKDSTIGVLTHKLQHSERATQLLDKEINGLSNKLHEAAGKMADRDKELAKLRQQLEAAIKNNDALAAKKVKSKLALLSKSSKQEDDVVESLNKATKSLEAEKTRLVEESATLRGELEHLHKSWQAEREEMSKIIDEKSKMISDNLEITALMQREIDFLRGLTQQVVDKQNEQEQMQQDASITPAMARRAFALQGGQTALVFSDEEEPSTSADMPVDKIRQKMDVATMRAHYENKQSMFEIEIEELTSHIARLEFENRSLRLMLEVAQRKVDELREEYTAEREGWLEERRLLAEQIEQMKSKQRVVDDAAKKAQELEKRLKEAIDERQRVETTLLAEKCQLELKVAGLQAQVNQAEESHGSSGGGLLTNKWRQLARTEVRWEKERADMVKVLDTSRKMIGDMKKKMEEAAEAQQKERAQLQELFTKEAHEMSLEKMKSEARVVELKEQNTKLSAACRQLGILQQEVKEERLKWIQEKTHLTETVSRSRDVSTFYADRIGRVHLATEKLKILLPLVEPHASIEDDKREYIHSTVKDIISSLAETLDQCRERRKKSAGIDDTLEDAIRSRSIDRDILSSAVGGLQVGGEIQLQQQSADDSPMAISQHHARQLASAQSNSSVAVSDAPLTSALAGTAASTSGTSEYATTRPYVGSYSDAHLTHRGPFSTSSTMFRPLDTVVYGTAVSEHRLAPASLYISAGRSTAGGSSDLSMGSIGGTSTHSLAEYKKTLNDVSRHLNSAAHRRAMARRQFFTEQSGGGVLSGYMSSSPTPGASHHVPSTSYSALSPGSNTLSRIVGATSTSSPYAPYVPTSSRSFDQASIGSSGGASGSAVGAYSLSRGYTSGLTAGATTGAGRSSLRDTSDSASYSGAYNRSSYHHSTPPSTSSDRRDYTEYSWRSSYRPGSAASSVTVPASSTSTGSTLTSKQKLSLRLSEFDAPL